MQYIGQKAGFLQLFTDFGEEKKAVFAFKKQKAKAAAFIDSAQANNGITITVLLYYRYKNYTIMYQFHSTIGLPYQYLVLVCWSGIGPPHPAARYQYNSSIPGTCIVPGIVYQRIVHVPGSSLYIL
jgi:hypothetical protein